MPSKKLANTILTLLLLQYILGMLANLYSKIPKVKSYDVFHQFGFIVFHALNGTLLLVLASVFLMQAIKQKSFKSAAIAGLAGILFAFICGEIFVANQIDFYSFLMSLGFLVALMSYVRIVFTMRVTGSKS